MPDREKVIKGLECCTTSCEMMSDCPYSHDCQGGDPDGVSKQMLSDALALLREQETVRFKVKQQRRSYPFWDAECSGCGYKTSTIHENWKYCPECGKKVKWDDD